MATIHYHPNSTNGTCSGPGVYLNVTQNACTGPWMNASFNVSCTQATTMAPTTTTTTMAPTTTTTMGPTTTTTTTMPPPTMAPVPVTVVDYVSSTNCTWDMMDDTTTMGVTGTATCYNLERWGAPDFHVVACHWGSTPMATIHYHPNSTNGTCSGPGVYLNVTQNACTGPWMNASFNVSCTPPAPTMAPTTTNAPA